MRYWSEPLDGPDQCVLGEVGGEVCVADEATGEAIERWDLGDEILGQRRAGSQRALEVHIQLSVELWL